MHFHLCRQIVDTSMDHRPAFPLVAETVETPTEACDWVESQVMSYRKFFVMVEDRDGESLLLMFLNALGVCARGEGFTRAWPVYNPRHYLLVAATAHPGGRCCPDIPLCLPLVPGRHSGHPDDPREGAPMRST